MTDTTPPGLEPETLDAAPDAPTPPDASTAPDAVSSASLPTAQPWPSEPAAVQASGSGPRRRAILGYLGAVVLGAVI
ncbi:MAG TPA: hypothetical protein VER83_01130, partial [Candidatus Nanopelagicales bacterium]|nr:hypothetical protein [Candidatus Nanopelagicales bacterium]